MTCPAPIDEIPMYVKAGSILPIGPKVQYTTEKRWDNLELRVYPGANGEFILYEDENDSYNYEKGLYSTIRMQWNEQTRTLTLDERQGSFPGMLKSRKFRVMVVAPGTTTDNPTKTISYNGKKQAIRL